MVLRKKKKWESLDSAQIQSSWYRRHWQGRNIINVRDPAVATTTAMHVSSGGKKDASTISFLSVQEKKELLRHRIAKLQHDKLAKQSV